MLSQVATTLISSLFVCHSNCRFDKINPCLDRNSLSKHPLALLAQRIPLSRPLGAEQFASNVTTHPPPDVITKCVSSPRSLAPCCLLIFSKFIFLSSTFQEPVTVERFAETMRRLRVSSACATAIIRCAAHVLHQNIVDFVMRAGMRSISGGHVSGAIVDGAGLHADRNENSVASGFCRRQRPRLSDH